MTWGAYYMFYHCPECGKKYRWSLHDLSETDFSNCPDCKFPGEFVGETKDIKQGENKYSDYEDV